jgi:hypothetical protein
MTWIIRRAVEPLLRAVSWRGRCGSIHLYRKPSYLSDGINLFIVGIHGGHLDMLADSLADAAWLVKHRPFGSTPIILGDWNVDLLPDFAEDPWAGRRSHSQVLADAQRKDQLMSFLEASRLVLAVPTEVRSPPGGVFALECLLAPITRLPVGEQANRFLPSAIDFAAGKADAIGKVMLHWRGVPADHAMMQVSVRHCFVHVPQRKRLWTCTDPEACSASLLMSGCEPFVDATAFHSRVLELQATWADRTTCAQRRRDRIPIHIRSLYARIADTREEHDRKFLQRQAHLMLKSWIKRRIDERAVATIAGGHLFSKAKRLYPLQTLLVEQGDGVVELADQALWAPHIGRQFESKWGVGLLQARANIMDYLRRSEGRCIQLQSGEVADACSKIRNRGKTDHYGVTVEAVRIMARTFPSCVTRFFETFLSSSTAMAEMRLRGRVEGKEASVSPPAKLRAITPLPAILQVADVIVADRIHSFISRTLVAPKGCWVGALPKTQPLEITHGLQSVIEKGLDDRGAAAVAQADIEKYYDSLPVVLVAQWLEHHGFCRSWCAAAVRMQLLPSVELAAGSVTVSIGHRSAGSLTGSRVAGALGRVPVEETMAARAHIWQCDGFPGPPGTVLTLASYVDNLFAASRTIPGAVRILEDAETHLAARWRLRIKPSSRSCMAAAYAVDDTPDQNRWPQTREFAALGHVVQDNGATLACWSRTKKAMWRAFFANCACQNARALPAESRLRLIDRAVLPVLDYRSTRWPASRQRGAEMDRMQRKMAVIAMRVPMMIGEPVADFCRRRARLAGVHCRQVGLWSIRHATRVLAWRDHLERPANAAAWPAALLHHRGRRWLEQRRLACGSTSVIAGRTGTRAAPDHVHTRWHDGLEYAKTIV